LAYWQLALENDDRYQEEVLGLTNRLFTVFDLDHDDTIGRSEFADFYGVFGLSVELAETVFTSLDTNEDGAITRNDMLEASGEFFRSDDVDSVGNVLYGPFGV
jgi:juvenile hormone diol kinase